jgi:hypothetical protein
MAETPRLTRRSMVAILGGTTAGLSGCVNRSQGGIEPARPQWATRWTGPDAGPARTSAVEVEGPTTFDNRSVLLKNARLPRFPIIEGAGGQYAAIQRRDGSHHLLGSHSGGNQWKKAKRVKYLGAIDERVVAGYGGEMESRPHRLVTLDPQSGSRRDIRRIGGRLSFSHILTGPDTLGYAINQTGGRLFRVETPIGETAWELNEVDGQRIDSVQASALSNDTVVLSIHADAGEDTFRPFVVAYDRESGEQQWLAEVSADQLTLGAEQVFCLSPARESGVKVVALGGADGETNWKTTVSVPAANNRCLVGTRLVLGKEQQVAGLNTDDGSVAWSVETTRNIHTIAGAANAVYVGTGEAIHCLSPAGRELSRSDFAPLMELSVSGGTLFVPQSSRVLAIRTGDTSTS